VRYAAAIEGENAAVHARYRREALAWSSVFVALVPVLLFLAPLRNIAGYIALLLEDVGSLRDDYGGPSRRSPGRPSAPRA
jgi:hypothetical protein